MRRIVLAASLCALAQPALAGLIQIDFTALVQGPTGPAEALTGQYILDTDVPWRFGDFAQPIVSASFTSPSLSGDATLDSEFTFGFANQDGITLPADYGSQLFALELTSDLFSSTGNVFDVLNSALTFDDLLPFDPDPSLFATTRFIYFLSNDIPIAVQGPLTSFSIIDLPSVPEPGTLWLVALAVALLPAFRATSRHN